MYGDTYEDDAKIGTWMKSKDQNIWFTKQFETIIREELNLPLNNEMIKQARSYEGDSNFFNRLAYMCKSTELELTEKQINFLARMLMQNYDLSVHALHHFCISGLIANITTKDIERKLSEIRKKHEDIFH